MMLELRVLGTWYEVRGRREGEGKLAAYTELVLGM
jgi:hypothetical protein